MFDYDSYPTMDEYLNDQILWGNYWEDEDPNWSDEDEFEGEDGLNYAEDAFMEAHLFGDC